MQPMFEESYSIELDMKNPEHVALLFSSWTEEEVRAFVERSKKQSGPRGSVTIHSVDKETNTIFMSGSQETESLR
jgi:hypothetical protein